MDLHLSGKTALVTGASTSGCGRAITMALAREGVAGDMGKHGITIHCVQPGRIMSEQIVAHDPTEEARREFAQREIPEKVIISSRS